MADWKNRIVGTDVKPAKDFLAHPMNFRIHPSVQQAALQGSIDELGWIDGIIENVTTGHVLNGHARIALALRKGDETPVPVTYVNLSPAEEAIALAVFDEITSLATKDREKLDALLRDVQPESAALQQMLSAMAAKEGLIPPDDPLQEWQGMPEFVHEDKEALRSIVVHFANEQDIQDFMAKVEQDFSADAKYIWHPKRLRKSYGLYADEP